MLFPSEPVRANYAETGHVAQRSGRIEMPLTRRRPGGMPLWYIYMSVPPLDSDGKS